MTPVGCGGRAGAVLGSFCATQNNIIIRTWMKLGLTLMWHTDLQEQLSHILRGLGRGFNKHNTILLREPTSLLHTQV
jgi:hypothetical protein